ncbi:MAG: hypothetical protein ACFFC6_15230 [Promethearchaeota archaeon]
MLSAQRALLDSVPGSLRAVTVGWKNTEILFRCIFDGEISEEYKEELEVAATEIIADFFEPYTISTEYIKLDEPLSIRPYFLKSWVFIRYEKHRI